MLWGVGIPTPGGYLLYHFSKLLDPECVYITRSVRITYFEHHYLSPHPFSGNPALPWGEPRGDSLKGFDLIPPLTGRTQ